VNSSLSGSLTTVPMPWLTRAVWYGVLTNNLVAMSIATHQSITLNRISAYRDSTSKIRSILGKRRTKPKQATGTAADEGTREFWDPRWSQLFVWQTPIMLLNFSILFYLAGFIILMAEPIKAIVPSWQNVDIKVRFVKFISQCCHGLKQK
jgi:hypothetical protein